MPGHRSSVAAALLGLVVAVLVPAGTAAALEPVPSELTLTADPTYADAATELRLVLTDDQGVPIAGAQVTVLRRSAGEWAPLTTVTTDAAGTANRPVTLSRDPTNNAFRAEYAGDADHASVAATTSIALVRRNSVLALTGPDSVVDEQSVWLSFRWLAGNGAPVAGRVTVYRSLAGGTWRRVATLRTGADGRTRLSVAPRRDSAWKASGAGLPWVRGDWTPVHRLDNLPPGRPVVLPDDAPRPRRQLPPQRHAVGDGPHVVITRIPSAIWQQMTGVTWHRGCPVGRARLRLVRVNYWDYKGYRRRGELVANADAARAIGGALAEMYRLDLPVRAMYRVDRFGWSDRSRGGDDYASMAAGNTSAFNCRDVTGRRGVRSPHSYGRSLDLNTWENPYRSAQGLVPNAWWQSHSHPRVAWRSQAHAVVQVMARHGLRWTYGLGDTQHFDYVGSSARAMARPVPCNGVCD